MPIGSFGSCALICPMLYLDGRNGEE
jgi:hypothetical protein